MYASDEFSKLIGVIYDCAFDPALWPAALSHVTEALNGEMADISVINPLSAQFHVAAHHNWPSQIIDKCRQNASINPTLPLGLVFPINEPHCSSRHLDIDAFHKSRYWRESFGDSDYYDYLVTIISREATSFGSFGVVGSRSRGAFDDDDLNLARLLAPHIGRSVKLSQLIGRYREQSKTLASALEVLNASALVLGPSGKIQFRNADGNAELRKGRVIKEVKGYIAGASSAGADFINRMLELAREGQFGADARLALPGGNSLNFTWAKLEKPDTSDASILLVVKEPATELGSPLSAASAAYNLSTSETLVLGQILEGRSLTEAAEILGVARSTVKTHLDAIFQRTKTHRQTELIRLVYDMSSVISLKREPSAS